MGVAELVQFGSGTAELREVSAFFLEHLDPVIALVGDVYIPVGADSDPSRRVELKVAGAGFAEAADTFHRGAELLNAIIPQVGDVKTPSSRER